MNSSTIYYLQEVFEPFGNIYARKMFGGYGIYFDGAMFGLVAKDWLYLKADASSVNDFESRNLSQFEFNKGNKIIKMSYYLAPEEIFDDPEKMTIRAKRAYAAAFRAKHKHKAN